MQKIKFLIVILFLYNNSFAEIKQDIAKTIVRVKSGSKLSTGFFWKNGSDVMATLHSIGSYSNIEVYVPTAKKWFTGSIIRVYKKADLVLIKLSGHTSASYIKSSYSSRPPVDTQSFTIGYNSNNTSYQDKDFTVGLLEGSTLDDLLPASASEQIKALGFPSLSLQIVYLKGNLLHGFSGAPIVDFNGKLIGVADGGLQNGAAGISWCINASHIALLESSSESLPSLNSTKINTLFAEDLEENFNAETIAYKNYNFRKTKTKSFAQLDETGSYSANVEMGLFQLLNMFRTSNIPFNHFTYDVYVEENSGATLVIPAGMQLIDDGNFLTAQSNDGNFKYYITVFPAYDAQMASLAFESSIMQITNTNTWTLDSRLSYLSPVFRPDGAIITRKAFFTYNTKKYGFEVLAAKQNHFLGLFLNIDNQLNLDNMQFYSLTEVAKYNLAMQLTTFTN